ncbi:MAG: phage holin family protein [Betaproteobacteria bacterium]|jgi:putative membrane protein|nr:phage holin family protein [Betaproteobacteria bacterium]MCH9848861.1 phage holin family protein [Betaproteobacteria bacterium]
MRFLLSWLLNALALLAVAYLLPDIHVTGLDVALIAAVVIGLVNMLIRPLLVVLTLPITILTLGLFILVINGVLFWGVGRYLQGFEVSTILAGIIGALAYSFISWLLASLVLGNKSS